MATQEGDGGEKGIFEQDPHVEQLRPEPSAPPCRCGDTGGAWREKATVRGGEGSTSIVR